MQQIGRLIHGMSFLHEVTTSADPGWILGTKNLKKLLSVPQTCSVSNYHECLGNCSDLVGEKLLIHVRSYLKYLMRKERRRYLDNKPKLSFSNVILAVTLVCRTFSSLDEPHLMCQNQDTLLAHTLQDTCLQSVLLRFLHLQMFGFSKYL